ncbi:TPA: replication protein [Yersinia enterocolitica]|nr:replication protein [Yersinia enterocolitica]HDL6889604.1 replication protein [Yersinia enterocolitica]
MNTAEILQFPSESGGQERRVVDTENGYTRIANELLEAVIGSGLTQNQLLITLAVIRKTYGYNKSADWVGNSQLSELTGLPETRCSTERNKLVKMNILTVTGRQVGINKEISSWQTKFNGICKPFTETVKFTESVKETFTESVNPTLQNLLNTKDNNTKDNKDIKKILPETKKSPSEKTSKSTQRPAGFSPSEGHFKMATEMGVNLQSEFDAFCDHHEAKGSTFKNWDAALRTWIRNSAKYSGRTKTYQNKPVTTPARATADNFSAKNYGVTDAPGWMEE